MSDVPTPWTVKQFEDDGEMQSSQFVRVYGPEPSQWVADCGMSEANAAFICRACNSHDELVAALKAMVRNACRHFPSNRRITVSLDLTKPLRIIRNGSSAETRGTARIEAGAVAPLVIVHWPMGDSAGVIRNGNELWELNGYCTRYLLENTPPAPVTMEGWTERVGCTLEAGNIFRFYEKPQGTKGLVKATLTYQP